MNARISTIVVVFLLAGSAFADRILDESFFDDRTYKLLTFNVDGNGDNSDPGKGQLSGIPNLEYAKQGVAKMRFAYWAHDGLDEFTELLGEFASAPVYCYITKGEPDDPEMIEFDPGVRYFGAWVFRNTRLSPFEFRAYDKDGVHIETALFDEDAVDGDRDVGSNQIVEYGFMGISADRDIARVEFPLGAVIDDLYYTPEPSAAMLLLLAGAGALRRR